MEMVWRILATCKKIPACFRQELISPRIAPSAQQKGQKLGTFYKNTKQQEN